MIAFCREERGIEPNLTGERRPRCVRVMLMRRQIPAGKGQNKLQQGSECSSQSDSGQAGETIDSVIFLCDDSSSQGKSKQVKSSKVKRRYGTAPVEVHVRLQGGNPLYEVQAV